MATLKTRRIIVVSNSAVPIIKIGRTVTVAASVVFTVLAFVPLFSLMTRADWDDRHLSTFQPIQAGRSKTSRAQESEPGMPRIPFA